MSTEAIKVTIIKVESIDGYVYGESGRKIEDMEELADPANVVASGYMKFKATILPTSISDTLYYKWSATGGALTDPEGTGNSYLEVKWDAPDGHEQDVTLTLEVKESASGPTICTETVELKTIRPYVVGVKFVDDWIWPFPGNEQQIADGRDPEYDATPDAVGGVKSYPVCYEKDTDLQVEVDLGGDIDDDGDNHLKKKTQIKVAGKLYYDGAEKGDLDEDSIDDDTEDWSTADYSTVDMHTGANFPDEVTEFEDFKMRWIFKVKDSSGNWVVAYEDTAGCGYSHETEHKETAGGRTFGLYLIYDDHEFANDADFRKLPLDYGCEWADGKNTKETIITDLLSNGFVAHYTWVGDCYRLASDFVRLCRTLGISADTHFWGASAYTTTTWNEAPYDPFAVDDMLGMRTINITPVGGALGSHVWGFHQWAFANGKTRDPSAGTTFAGDWEDYEDHLFETTDPPGGYRRVTAVDLLGNPTAAVWEGNQPGRTDGCEPNGTFGSGRFWDWRGPDR
jgi:hypothetical protein